MPSVANYPTSLDDPTTLPTAATLAAGTLATFPHSDGDGVRDDAILSLEVVVGIPGSLDPSSHDFRIGMLEAVGPGAPTGANYLVGSAQAGLSAEIVVGLTPGGELGGSWASPTVDTVHSGSSHAATQSAAEATAASALALHEADTTNVHGIIDTSTLVLTSDSRLSDARTPVGTALLSGRIFVGNGSNVVAAVAVSGDATLANTGALTLATSGVTAATYGSATEVAQVVFDAKGRATSASNITIQIAESQVTNLVTDLAAKQSSSLTSAHLLVGNGSNVATDVALSGDATLANTGALTLVSVGPGATGPIGSATTVPVVTIDAKGRVTGLTSATIAIPQSAVTSLVSDLAAKVSTTLTSAHLLVGNGSNVATDTAVTGDVTISNTGVTTLATVTSVTPATYGSATQVAQVTVNAKGLITGASNVSIAIAQSAVTNLTSDLALKAPLASPTFTGVVTLPAGSKVGAPVELLGTALSAQGSISTTGGFLGLDFIATEYGSLTPRFDFQCVGGTAVAKTAIASGVVMGAIHVGGQGTTTGVDAGKIECRTTQAFTDTAGGCAWDFYTTTNNTITKTVALTLDQDQTVTTASKITAGRATSADGVVTRLNLTTVASTIATSLFTKTSHGMSNGQALIIGGLVNTTGVTNGSIYWVVSVAANTFQLSLTLGGAAITLGGTADAAITTTLCSVTSATAAWVAADVGRPIVAWGIPAGTTISQVANSTTIAMSAGPLASAPAITLYIGGYVGPAITMPNVFAVDAIPSNTVNVINAALGLTGLRTYGVALTFNLQRADGDPSAGTPVQSGEVLANLTFGGSSTTAASPVTYNGALIRATATETYSSTAGGTKIELRTTPNTTHTLTTAVTIDQDQSVTCAGALTVTGAATHSSTTALNGAVTMGEAINIVLGTSTGTKIGTATNQKLAFFNATPVVQQTDGAALTNNVTVGGTTNTIADFTSLTVYATDAAAIRNNIYQLARKVKIIDDALRAYALLS